MQKLACDFLVFGNSFLQVFVYVEISIGALEMKTKTISLFFVLVFILSACGGASTFQRNQDRWERQNISHYRFTVTVSCFCPFANVEVTYEVLNGQVVNQSVHSSPDNPVDEAQVSDFYQPYNTIEKVFDYVGEAIRDADETTIDYDPTYGFPINISIDWIKQAIDDEMYLTISNFEALP
jgi:hypothetical protein